MVFIVVQWEFLGIPSFLGIHFAREGCPLSSDFRTLIIDEIVTNGGDIHSGYFPGQFSDIAKVFKVSKQTVKNVWLHLHMDSIEEETLPT